jgi:hypothetical protein
MRCFCPCRPAALAFMCVYIPQEYKALKPSRDSGVHFTRECAIWLVGAGDFEMGWRNKNPITPFGRERLSSAIPSSSAEFLEFLERLIDLMSGNCNMVYYSWSFLENPFRRIWNARCSCFEFPICPSRSFMTGLHKKSRPRRATRGCVDTATGKL